MFFLKSKLQKKIIFAPSWYTMEFEFSKTIKNQGWTVAQDVWNCIEEKVAAMERER